MQVIGVDVGSRRIGVASGDTDARIAVPIGVVQRSHGIDVFEIIVSLAVERNVGLIVVGIPLLLSGLPGQQARETEEFISQLKKHTPCAVVTTDERLTSIEAAKRNQESRGRGRSRRRLGKEDIDAGAAALILQSWFDSNRALG